MLNLEPIKVRLAAMRWRTTEDMTFKAHAPDDIDALIAEVERLRAFEAAYRKVVRRQTL